MNHYDNPCDLRVGEDVIFDNGAIYRVVEELTGMFWNEGVRLIGKDGEIYLYYDNRTHSLWRRLCDTAPPTERTPVVHPGATCRRCKVHNPWAEGDETHVCYGCAEDGYGRTWNVIDKLGEKS